MRTALLWDSHRLAPTRPFSHPLSCGLAPGTASSTQSLWPPNAWPKSLPLSVFPHCLYCAVSREFYKPTCLVSVKSEKTEARWASHICCSTCELRLCRHAGMQACRPASHAHSSLCLRALALWWGKRGGSFSDLETFQTDLLPFLFSSFPTCFSL